MENIESITRALEELKRTIKKEKVDLASELPLDLFLFATTLMPFVNVDLLITNAQNQVLLSWREDEYYGKGWHIPGGIIRHNETIADRIQFTAVQEIGCKVEVIREPIAVREHFIKGNRDSIVDQRERSHNIVFLYKCYVNNEFEIDNGNKSEHDNGFLKWFDAFPEDLLACHRNAYGDILANWFDNNNKVE